MDNDQELLDRFAIAAMGQLRINFLALRDGEINTVGRVWADACWELAIEMKKARDRICITAKAAEMDPGPFPVIDKE